jgi:glycosyltransferase involved in cell wall biosynthesis
MQEIKKRRIVIASVLKPIDDTRMFEKLGQSLAKFYEVHILGYTAPTPSSTEISFYPHGSFRRISLTRVWTPWRMFGKVVRLRPAVLIITTHELLWMALASRIFIGCKIVYDVQENYYRNIIHTRAFPPLLRNVVALYVRLKEFIASPFIAQYFLAERCYAQELPFARSRMTILENKFRISGPSERTVVRQQTDRGFHLLFSGTLAESTGIFSAIGFVKRMHTVNPAFRLTIIGYCAQANVLENIRNALVNCPFIELVGGSTLVPHSEIIRAIGQCDFGIVSYLPDKSTGNRIPTKLYEYMACRLPILITDHPLWTSLCEPYQASVTVDFRNHDVQQISDRLRHLTFYTQEPTDVFWDDEEPKLWEAMTKL